MLNILWPILIIISFSYGIMTGRLNELNQSIFDSAESVIDLLLTLLGTMCLWNGIMEIASDSTILEKLTKILKPMIKVLFPEIKENKKVQKEISMNMIANILRIRQCSNTSGN